MNILGISCYYHDAGAALVRDGALVAAAEEERFNRQKHYNGFPERAIEYCLREGGTSIDEVDYIGFYESRWSNSTGFSRPSLPVGRERTGRG